MGFMKNFAIKTIWLIGLMMSQLAQAEVTVTDAWVRASAPGQKVGAAYMTLTSVATSELVYVETGRAEDVQMHSMEMKNGVMKMRTLESLTLSAHQPVKLAPGGYHLMLFGFKAPFKPGEKVTFKLCFKDAKGDITHQMVTVPVKE
jgi:periplasmic copper chaperone A